MDWIFAVILIIAILILSQIVNNISKSDKIKSIESYKGKYKKRELLTENERNAFVIIKKVTNSLNFQLYTKVRLADIVEPSISGKQWQTLFNKIQSKHVDFLVTDNNFNIICIIEIDDKSHEKNNRKERDKFVDFILKDNGITTIRKKTKFTQLELQNEIIETTKKAP